MATILTEDGTHTLVKIIIHMALDIACQHLPML
jgi:hypothetical protein